MQREKQHNDKCARKHKRETTWHLLLSWSTSPPPYFTHTYSLSLSLSVCMSHASSFPVTWKKNSIQMCFMLRICHQWCYQTRWGERQWEAKGRKKARIGGGELRQHRKTREKSIPQLKPLKSPPKFGKAMKPIRSLPNREPKLAIATNYISHHIQWIISPK